MCPSLSQLSTALSQTPPTQQGCSSRCRGGVDNSRACSHFLVSDASHKLEPRGQLSSELWCTTESLPHSPGKPVLLQAVGKPQPDPRIQVFAACPATSSDYLIFRKWSRHQWILQILKDYISACYTTSERDPPPRLQPFKLSPICLLVCSLRSADRFDYLNIWKLSHAFSDRDHLKYYPAGLEGRHTVRKQKHPTHKNMWQELANDTIPKGSAIYPSKDKLLLHPLKPRQFFPQYQLQT